MIVIEHLRESHLYHFSQNSIWSETYPHVHVVLICEPVTRDIPWVLWIHQFKVEIMDELCQELM